MTYDARELSDDQGAPILLATFALGEKLWRFVRGDADYVHNGNTYLATPGGLEPTRIRDSGETQKSNVTLTVDRAFPIAELWRVSPPAGVVAVQLVETHDGESEDAVSWMGHVSNVAWVGDARAEVTLAPGAMALKSNGLRRKWQKSCPHVLYGPKCKLPRLGERVPAELTAVDGAELQAAAFDGAGDLVGGVILWLDGDDVEQVAKIDTHAGDTITLTAPIADLVVGSEVEVRPVLHQVDGLVASITGLVVTSPALANGMKFNGGFVEWTDAEGITDWRAITDHAGSAITLMTHAPRIQVGTRVTFVEGCARTLDRCAELENTDNYGGIPYFITKNPFNGDPIY